MCFLCWVILLKGFAKSYNKLLTSLKLLDIWNYKSFAFDGRVLSSTSQFTLYFFIVPQEVWAKLRELMRNEADNCAILGNYNSESIFQTVSFSINSKYFTSNRNTRSLIDVIAVNDTLRVSDYIPNPNSLKYISRAHPHSSYILLPPSGPHGCLIRILW